jgi:UDP-2,3-diacylglucosamine pyrophosphatase LpxH
MPNTAVVLSDVHIGNGAPTTWYQPSVHEPYLINALNWIEQRGDVQELILLGDLFDIWTYPPSVRPPSVAEIIAANPNTLGPGGALARAIAAVPRATFLLGNHDCTLTPADIATLQAAVGPLTLAEPVHVLTGSTGAKTVFSHGHLWTMFNAPDDSTQFKPMPVGHFVTRAFAYEMAKLLKPGETVADRPNMGAPDGFELWPFLKSLKPNQQPDIADMLLDYVCGRAEMPESLPILLPSGVTTTVNEAKVIYADLFTRWAAREGEGVLNAARAAMADGSGEYLAWFTFTVVDLDTASAEIFQVTKGASGYQITESPAGPLSSAILPPALDFSCYIRITNQTSQPLTRTALANKQGTWVVPPPASIVPGAHGDGWLQDNLGAHGSEGSVSYSQAGHGLSFSFSCPTGIYQNSASGPGNNFIARSGSGDWQPRGKVPPWGHPLQVRFTVAGS